MCKYCKLYAWKFTEYNFCPMCSEKIKEIPFISKYKANKSYCFRNATQNTSNKSFVYRDEQ